MGERPSKTSSLLSSRNGLPQILQKLQCIKIGAKHKTNTVDKVSLLDAEF